jgi:hypothetical protein
MAKNPPVSKNKKKRGKNLNCLAGQNPLQQFTDVTERCL